MAEENSSGSGFWNGVGGALVGGALGLFSGSQNNKYNQQAIQLQFDNAVKLWNMQNAYNTPLQQIKRLRQAGLNPMLMYNNAAAGGSASTIQNPSVSPKKSPLDSAVDKITQLAQLLMMREEIKGKKIDNENAVKTGFGIDLQNKLQEQSLNFNEKNNPLKLASLGYENDIKEIEKKSRELAFEFDKKANPVRLNLLDNQYDTAVAALDRLNVQKRNDVIKGVLMLVQAENTQASTESIKANTVYTKYLTKQLIEVGIPKGKSELAILQLKEGFERLIHTDIEGYVNSPSSPIMQLYNANLEKAKGDGKSSLSLGNLDESLSTLLLGDETAQELLRAIYRSNRIMRGK